jgi:hypothetical protein
VALASVVADEFAGVVLIHAALGCFFSKCPPKPKRIAESSRSA